MAARSDGSAAADARAALVKALRAHRPEKLVAIVGGERRDIAVPRRAHRWERVATVLESLEWSRLECQDAKGQLLGVIEGEAREDEDPAEVAIELGEAPPGMSREHGFMVMLLKGQQVALAHQAATMRVVVEGFQSVAETAFRRLEALEAVQERTLKLAHDAAVRVASSDGDRDPNDEAMLKLLDKAMGGSEKGMEKTFERVARRILPESLLKPEEPKKLSNGAAAKEAT